eukprot:3084616-Prymnesium_polylepis.1
MAKGRAAALSRLPCDGLVFPTHAHALASSVRWPPGDRAHEIYGDGIAVGCTLVVPHAPPR